MKDPSKTYVISDLHFCDESVFRMTRRCSDFCDINEHDKAIIENWNHTVGTDETVYLLGDVGDINNAANYVKDCLKQLHGHITLICGNHDKDAFPDYGTMREYFTECGIEAVIPYPIIVNNFYCMSHEPVYVNMLSPMANIFGHVHDNCSYRTVSPRSHCVCVERIGYKPISLNRVMARISECKREM